jgi:uncharacterized membrane protein YhaH (DUF805 family)
MGFGEAVRTCFSKYANFTGRARRSEYWYFVLFQVIVTIVANGVDYMMGTGFIGGLVDLALILPSLAVAVRRLHDIDKAGWWVLIGIIPLVGWVFLIIWTCTKGTLGPNRFGADPLPMPFGAPA